MAESYHSDGRVTGSGRDPLQLRQAASLLRVMRSEPPGVWGDNRDEQVKHFRDVIYIAIREVMGLVGGSTYQVSKRRKPRRGKTTFGPGSTVAKSSPSSQSQGRDEDYTPFDDYDHRLCGMLARPNKNEVFGELAAKIVLQNRLTGVGPVWSVPNCDGKPVELYALRTPKIYPAWQWSREFPTGAWRVMPQYAAGWSGYLPAQAAGGCILPNEEVKRFMDPHPMIDWDGYSPLSAGAVHLDVLESINESRKSAMDNGLQLDAVIVIPGADQDELNRMTARMTEKVGGSRNARKVLGVAPNGMADGKGFIQQLGTTPREMDFSQAWEQETKFCLSLFGVPAAVVDLATSTSYSERYAAWQQFHDKQHDYLSRFATWLTKTLCWPWESFPGEYLITVKPRPINDRDFNEKVKSRQLQYDLVTYNEARAADDLDHVEGGDVPVSVYVEMQKQKAAPKPEPAANPMAALAGGGDAEGGPTAGAVPQPANKAGEGSRPPTVEKSLDGANTLSGSDGGFLVPPGQVRKRRRKKVRSFLAGVLKSLDAGEPVPARTPARFDMPPVIHVTVPRPEPTPVHVAAPAPQPAPVVNVTVPPQEAPVVNLTVDPVAPPRTVTKTAKRGTDGTWTVTESEGAK